MEVPAVKVTQAGKALYLGSMTAQQLLDSCITTEWDPNIGWDLEQQGYQREPHEEHYKGIAKYLSSADNPFMPTGALLSSRDSEYGKLEFRSLGVGKDAGFGHLIVPDGRQLFIVDYQHRWRGFRLAIEQGGLAELKDFVIPVTIMSDVQRQDEIKQFYLINSKQRRIDTDLALALLQTMAGGTAEDELVGLVGPGKKYRIRATRLTFKIAASDSGPWAGRIKQPHDVPQPDAVLSVKSFADSLQPIISRRSPVYAFIDDKLVQVLENYWVALKDLMPQAFANPRDYSIQRTPGVYAMHIVAAKTVFKVCGSKGQDYSVQNMMKILSSAYKYVDATFWTTKGEATAYASSSGQRALATLLRNEIEKQFPVP